MAVIALAEPVVVGIRLMPQARGRRQDGFLWRLGASRMVWVLVMSCTVVMEPWRMPKVSWITLTTGARQLVVQLAAVTMRWTSGSYLSSLTPTTTLSTPSSFTGALTTTRSTPWSR